MSEVVEGQEPEKPVDDSVNPDDGQSNDDDGIQDLEAALVEISKLRKENASRRVRNKEVDEKLKEYEAWKNSQKSDFERLQEEKTAMEKELALLRRSRTQREVAEDAELPLELAEFITGNDKDEMKANAKKLKKLLSAAPASSPNDLGAGRRGDHVGGSKDRTAGAVFLDSLIEESKLVR